VDELDKLLVIKKKFVLMLPCLLHKQLVHLSTCLLVNHITMSTSQATRSLVYLSTCLLVYLSTILPCLLHKQLVHLSTCQLVNLSTCQPYYHVYFTSNSFTCLPEKKFENSIYILTLTKGGRLS